MKKLNLGSGNKFFEGYLNVDLDANAPNVDVVADISQPLPFADESIDAIMASHSLEHISYVQTKEVLTDWKRVLKKGGMMDIKVPDCRFAFEAYLKGSWCIDYGFGERNILPMIYGNHGDIYQLHKALFTYESLWVLLNKLDFKDAQRVFNSETPAHELHVRGIK